MNEALESRLKELIEKYVGGEITETQFRDIMEEIIKTTFEGAGK